MKTPPSPPAHRFSAYQTGVIILLALTQFTVVLDFMVMSPLGDMLMKAMSLTTKQFGFAVSGYAFSAGIAGLLTAGFADRFDRKKLLLFFYLGFLGGTLLCGLAHTYELLLAARIITGLFGGVIGSISMAIASDLFLPEQRGRAMGMMQMSFGASQVLGIPISLYLANHWGWQMPFLMIVGLAAIIIVAVAAKMQPVREHLLKGVDHNAFHHLWHTVRRRDYRIGFLATAFLSLGGFMMMPWGSAFAINNLHVTPTQLPQLFMISGIASLIIMPLMGTLSDKMDKFTLFAIASGWMIVMVTIYTNLTPVPFAIVVLMNILFMVGIMSRAVPAMALNSSLPKLTDRGAFMSINASLQQLSGGLAAAVGGMIVVQRTKTSPLERYNILGYIICGITIVSIGLLYRVNEVVKRRKAAVANTTPVPAYGDTEASIFDEAPAALYE